MSCQDIYEFLDGPASRPAMALPSGVAEHCAQCENCHALVDLFRSNVHQAEAAPEVQSRVEKTVAGSLKPVVPLPSSGRLALRFLVSFAVLSVLGVILLGTGAWRAAGSGPFAVVALVLAASAVMLSLVLSWLMVPGSRKMFDPSAVMFGVATALPLALALLFPWQTGPPFVATGLRCGMEGFLLAAPAGVCLWMLARRGAILSPGLAGASIGLLSGLVGALVLHFGCTVLKAPHMMVWHAGIPVASAALGFLLGRFLGHQRVV